MATIESLLTAMDEEIDNGRSVLLARDKCTVDMVKMRSMIDDIRVSLPNEIKQAKAVVNDRKEILEIANADAEKLIRQAEARARNLIDNNTVVIQANSKATAMLDEAEQRANALMSNATAKAKEILRDAKTRSDDMLRDATIKSEEMISSASQESSELLSSSTSRSNTMLDRAENRSLELKQASFGYAERSLRDAEEAMSIALKELTTTRMQLLASAEESVKNPVLIDKQQQTYTAQQPQKQKMYDFD